MTFNGAGVDEAFDVSANGQRVRFFRNIGNITMDLDDVEQIDLATLAGVDSVRVRDMAGTDLTTLDNTLEGTPASGTGDGAIDTITIDGTNGDDAIVVTGANGSVTVAGLVATVNLTAADYHALVIDTLAGTDMTDSSGLAPNTVGLTVPRLPLSDGRAGFTVEVRLGHRARGSCVQRRGTLDSPPLRQRRTVGS